MIIIFAYSKIALVAKMQNCFDVGGRRENGI